MNYLSHCSQVTIPSHIQKLEQRCSGLSSFVSLAKVAMIFMLICMVMVVTARTTLGLQGADFDIYPSFSNSDEDSDASSNMVDGVSLAGHFSRFTGTLSIVGGAYIGFRLAKKIYSRIRKSSSNPSTSLTRDMEYIRNELGEDTKVNVTMVSEMKKEQEELWRFIHSLFKNQEEMMARLESSSSLAIPQSVIRELEESFDKKVKEISMRLDSMETRIKAINREMPELAQQSSLTEVSVQGMIQTEVEELSNSLAAVKKEIKNQTLRWLKEHDDAMVEKIRFFGEDIKKLIKKDSSSSSIASALTSKNVKPRPRGNDTGKE